MSRDAKKLASLFKTEELDNSCLKIFFSQKLLFEQTAQIWNPLLAIPSQKYQIITLDFHKVEEFNSSTVVLIQAIQNSCNKHKCKLKLTNIPDGLQKLLQANYEDPSPRAASTFIVTHLTVTVADFFIDNVQNTRTALEFIGDTFIAIIQAILKPRKIRWFDVVLYFQRCGAEALPIVTLICALMGVILAFQASMQLHDFGADTFVADLVGLSITREMGPLMVAIICAGRSGASFAAEIGTMKVGEEVDALVTMGLNPQRFLVIPKLLGLVLAMPLLILLGDMIGILGGMFASCSILQLPMKVYINKTIEALQFWDIFGGIIKGIIFAILIASIGCYYGFRTDNSAQSVGKVTTSAVVAGIFFIILSDAIFSIIFSILGV